MVQPDIITVEDERQPLILTLWMDEPAQLYFDDLRWAYFPPERNYLAAHLTLFHALPDEKYIYTDLQAICRQEKTFDLKAGTVVSIGKGTAIKIESPTLLSFHRRCQALWYPALSAQDKQKLWAHITIQNKVSVEDAQKLKAFLIKSFEPFVFKAIGLQLWRYLGGPWEAVKSFKFQADST